MAIFDDEKGLFRQSQKDTLPLKPNDKLHYRKAPPKAKRITQPKLDEQQLLSNPHLHVEKVTAEDPLYFHRPGVQPKRLRELRQGKLSIEAELDLHGLTRQQADSQLTQFILRALKQQLRVIHIIHGKGQNGSSTYPPLKNLVHQQLRQIHAVLAFCSAPISQGGKGAVTVLLKRQATTDQQNNP